MQIADLLLFNSFSAHTYEYIGCSPTSTVWIRVFCVRIAGESVAEVELLMEQHAQLEREVTAHMQEMERSVKRPTLIESDLRARRRRTSPRASLQLSRRSVRRPAGVVRKAFLRNSASPSLPAL